LKCERMRPGQMKKYGYCKGSDGRTTVIAF
jgi:hypothetical protein